MFSLSRLITYIIKLTTKNVLRYFGNISQKRITFKDYKFFSLIINEKIRAMFIEKVGEILSLLCFSTYRIEIWSRIKCQTDVIKLNE